VFRKHPGLLRLLAGLGILLLVTVSLTAIPSFGEIGRERIEEAISRLQRGRQANTEVTSAPLRLPDYMWDIAVKDGETADLRPFVPSVATLVPGILTGSGIRIHVGQADSPYNLELQWDTGSRVDQLELTLFDCLERPIGYWRGVSGKTEVTVPGGLYKLSLSSEGLLGEDFKLAAQATKTTEPPKFEVPDMRSIPTIDIQMSGAMFQSWDVQRAAFLEALETQKLVDTSGCKRVLADLVTEGGRRTVQLWAAGLGELAHFSPEAPSFTGRIMSGPLLFGMSRFKLYTIRTQEGLLNHVVGSIMYDEGIFVPRWMMVRVTLNGRSLGVYLLTETPRSEGFFAWVDRYDGQVVGGTGELHADPEPPVGLSKQKPMPASLEYSMELSSRVNRLAFHKTLAFVSRFHVSHAIEGGELRFYRHPYLDSPEPVIRDMNVDLVRQEQRALLVHTSCWLGPRLTGRGPHFNPKVFPMDTPIGQYTVTPWTLNVAGIDPALTHFVKLPENRETFDQYLLYACDEAIQRRFLARIKSAYETVLPFLDEGGPRPFGGFPDETSWISHRVEVYTSYQSIVSENLPVFRKRSALLISVSPAEPASPATPETRTVSLYNLSPFSARLRLPDYARIAETSVSATQGDGADGWYLAPSLLFPTIIPVSITESQGDLNPYPLTREAAQRFLSLERVRFRSHPDPSSTLVPFVDVQIPADRLNDFMSTLETTSLVTLGSTYALPADRNILTSELPMQVATAPQTKESRQGDLTPDVVILPLSLEQIGDRHRLTLLVSNFSPDEISLDLATLRWRVGRGQLEQNSPPGPEIPYSLHAVWELGERPKQIESSHITLGATSLIAGSSQSELGSPMFWTGALQGLLNGPADEAMPNAVLAEFDLMGNGERWIQTDANGLAQSASSDGVPRKVVVQEPYEVYLPIEPPEMPPIYGYQSLPASATLSVSDYLEPYTEHSLIDGNIKEFWHVENPPRSSVHWVTFNFGEPVTIEGLAILPREGYISQLWESENAVFQGSNNTRKEDGWVGIGRLFVDKAALETKGWEWLRYTLPNTTAYRYYRILIDDPTFRSLAEVKFQVKEWGGESISLTELIEQGVLEVGSAPSSSPKTIRLKDKNTIISNLVVIPPGYVLALEPGSNLRFTHNAGILSYSPIHAIGTAQQPIILSPAEGSTDWLGVAVVNASGTSEFRHVQMNQATAGAMGEVQFSGGLTLIKTSVIIADTELNDFASEDGLHLSNASFEISGLTISNSKSDALDSDWSYGTITDSTFWQSGGDGVDLCGSWATITNSLMEGCADKGISIGEGSVANIMGVCLIRNRTGIAVKDQSIVSLTDSEVAENEYGLLRYIKKPIYIYPELTLENNRFRDNQTRIHEESPTSWTRRFD